MQRWQRSSKRGKRFHHVTAKLNLAVCHDPHRCGPSVMQVAPIKITSRTIGCDASFDVDKLPWKQDSWGCFSLDGWVRQSLIALIEW